MSVLDNAAVTMAHLADDGDDLPVVHPVDKDNVVNLFDVLTSESDDDDDEDDVLVIKDDVDVEEDEDDGDDDDEKPESKPSKPSLADFSTWELITELADRDDGFSVSKYKSSVVLDRIICDSVTTGRLLRHLNKRADWTARLRCDSVRNRKSAKKKQRRQQSRELRQRMLHSVDVFMDAAKAMHDGVKESLDLSSCYN
jgi:hypothetical protein